IALGQVGAGASPASSGPRDHVDDPNIVILVPTFQEPLPNLLSTIDAIAESDYPGKKLRVIIGFDGYDVLSTMYTIERLLTGAVVHGYNPEDGDDFDDMPPPPFASNPGSPALSPSSSPLFGATSPRMTPTSPALASASASPQMQKVLSPSPSMLSLNGGAGGSIPSTTGKNKYNGLLKVAQYTRDSFDQGVTPGLNSNTKYSLRGQPLDPAYMGAEGGPDCITLEYKGIEYNICRFEHGGKLHAQSKMLEVVKRNVEREIYPSDSLLLFLDSDTTLVAPTVRRFVDHFSMHPRLHAATGFIVSRNGHGNNFFQQLQDAEYIFMQFGTRLPEVVFGAVTCLPGALTAIKYQTMCELAEVYFNQPDVDSTFEFCRRKLGEDRFLTHLAMEHLPSHSIGFIPDAIAKTEAPGNFYDLLRQRRRWLLGSLANELYCVTTPSFWIKFPGVALMRFLGLFQVGGSLFYMFLFDFVVRAIQKPQSLSTMDWFMLFLVPLLNWSLVLMWSVWQRRWKGIAYFFMYCALSLFFETSYCTYTLWTVNEKTWGGPRAQAANADDDSQDGEDHGEDPASIIERGGKLPQIPTAV
ncbi:chitin synthase-domain-containing protein, partial [Catenaria anguillulae PL171]